MNPETERRVDETESSVPAEDLTELGSVTEDTTGHREHQPSVGAVEPAHSIRIAVPEPRHVDVRHHHERYVGHRRCAREVDGHAFHGPLVANKPGDSGVIGAIAGSGRRSSLLIDTCGGRTWFAKDPRIL